MLRRFLFAKLHSVKVTGADLNYEGSFGIDQELLEVSGIQEHEQIHVYNVTNGHRFITYAISLPYGCRQFVGNGACAHLVSKGDNVIICSYTDLSPNEIANFKPKVILMTETNDYQVKDEQTLADEIIF